MGPGVFGVLWNFFHKTGGSRRGPFGGTVYKRENMGFYEEKTFAPPIMESTGPSEGNLQNQRSREQRSVGQDRSSKLWLGTSSSL